MTDDAISRAGVQRAEALFDLGRRDEAATIARDVLTREPANVRALVLLSRAVRDLRPAESFELACKAVSVEPNSSWIHVNAAWAADASGDTSEAVASARRAVALDAHDAVGFQALAQLLAKANGSRWDAAVAANKSIELAPHDPVSWIAVGNVALADGNVGEARRFYEHALALQPDNRTAQLNLAAVRQRDGEVGHSMDLLQSIIRINPHDEAARRRLDDLVRLLLNEMVWLSFAVGFVLAIIVGLINGTG